jgi:hypothetical protein
MRSSQPLMTTMGMALSFRSAISRSSSTPSRSPSDRSSVMMSNLSVRNSSEAVSNVGAITGS